MNELEKPQVDNLLTSLETISKESVNKVRPKIFLFDDLLAMPQRSRVMLLNDIAGDILTMALRGASAEIKEAVLSAISPRQRRMIEADLGSTAAINPREVAIARRAVAQEAIRLANAGQIQLKEAAPAGELRRQHNRDELTSSSLHSPEIMRIFGYEERQFSGALTQG